MTKDFVTLGMFIIDEFDFRDEKGERTGREKTPQIGGGGTYAGIGARIWLQPERVGVIVDRGSDFPPHIQASLNSYGPMWHFRDRTNAGTTRAMNSYRGEIRNFEYLTPRLKLNPRDLQTDLNLSKPGFLHFICSPSRAKCIVSQIHEVADWKPVRIYEPIPDICTPEELPGLIDVLPEIDILSPNAEEALSLLSMLVPPSPQSIEKAARRLFDIGIGPNGTGSVIIRGGALGAYILTPQSARWIEAYWLPGSVQVVDVTGAGNSFLGGLAAGLMICQETEDRVLEATFYASVSASYVVEQDGLPQCHGDKWNDDFPLDRLKELKTRHGQ